MYMMHPETALQVARQRGEDLRNEVTGRDVRVKPWWRRSETNDLSPRHDHAS